MSTNLILLLKLNLILFFNIMPQWNALFSLGLTLNRLVQKSLASCSFINRIFMLISSSFQNVGLLMNLEHHRIWTSSSRERIYNASVVTYDNRKQRETVWKVFNLLVLEQANYSIVVIADIVSSEHVNPSYIRPGNIYNQDWQ